MPMARRSPKCDDATGASQAGNDPVRESDHRIAGNLQLLMAMIAAERCEVTEPQARLVLERMLGRIGAIAEVHRHRTHPQEAGMVEIGAYLRTLVGQIEAGCRDGPGRRRLHLAADTALVPARLAAAIGLVASECVLDACKHAYPPHLAGDVRIALTLASAHALRLTIEDDGTGGSGTGASGFGARLVEMLATRIGGALIREDAYPGTRIVLAVSLP